MTNLSLRSNNTNIYKQCLFKDNMKKIIQKYGNALIVRFNVDDMRIYKLKEGQLVDLKIKILKDVKLR